MGRPAREPVWIPPWATVPIRLRAGVLRRSTEGTPCHRPQAIPSRPIDIRSAHCLSSRWRSVSWPHVCEGPARTAVSVHRQRELVLVVGPPAKRRPASLRGSLCCWRREGATIRPGRSRAGWPGSRRGGAGSGTDRIPSDLEDAAQRPDTGGVDVKDVDVEDDVGTRVPAPAMRRWCWAAYRRPSLPGSSAGRRS